jgi:hypothetical protein
MPFAEEPEQTIANAQTLLLQRGLIQLGTQLVVQTDIVTRGERFDSIQLRRVT